MLRIITDSSSNITQEEAKELGVTVMPLTVCFGTLEYRDGVDIDTDSFYKMLVSEKSFPHTSQLSEESIESAVKECMQDGDEVLILPISSALSGSYERCAAVAERTENVYALDTLCTTVMLKMLVLKAVQHRDAGAKEVMKILSEYRKRIKLYAALDTLEYLGKGGRLSKTSAFLGTMLKIKPVITINGQGRVELVSKQFGMSKCISATAALVDKNRIDFAEPVFFIYTMDEKNTVTLFEKAGIQYSQKDNICPVIGSHIGPAAAGIVYAERT